MNDDFLKEKIEEGDKLMERLQKMRAQGADTSILKGELERLQSDAERPSNLLWIRRLQQQEEQKKRLA